MTITFVPGNTLQNDQTSGLQNNGDGDDDFDFANPIFDLLKIRVAASFAAGLIDNSFATDVAGAVESDVLTVQSDGELTGVRFTDGPGGDGTLLDDPSGLQTVDGHAIVLTADAAEPDTIVYGIDSVTGEIVFAIQMIINDMDASTKTIDLRIITYQPIFHSDPTMADEPVDLGDFLRIEAADLTGLFDFSVLDATKFLYGVVGDIGGGFVVIGKDPAIEPDGTPVNGGGAGDLINTSKGGGDTTIGVNNQHFTADSDITDVEQGAYFTYTLGLAAGTFGDADGITPTNLVPVDEARLQVSQTQAQSTTPPGMKITTLNYTFGEIADGQDFVNDLTDAGDAHGIAAPLSRITVYDTDPNSTALFSIDLTLEAPGPADISPDSNYQVFFDSPNMVRIIGLDQKDWVEWETTGLHTRVLVEAVSGKWDIGAFEIDQPSTEFFNIGDHIVIDDDAPMVTLVGDANAMLVLDESVRPGDEDNDDDNDGDPFDGDPLAVNMITAAGYTTVNTSKAGTDGAKSDEWTFDTIAANTISGLVDTATMANVLLNTETDGSGDIIRIVGTVNGGATEVVRWEIDKTNGTVTVTQSRAVKHDDPTDHDENGVTGTAPGNDPAMLSGSNKIVVKHEIIDNDNDPASDTVDLTGIFKFEDDGPDFTFTLESDAELVLDESVRVLDGDPNAVDGAPLASSTVAAGDLFSTLDDFGSDGVGATPTNYVFKDPGTDLDSGLLDSATDQPVVYNLDLVTGDIVGTVDGGTADGQEVVRYTINAMTGDVSATQTRSVEHGNPADLDESLTHPDPLKIQIERTIFDGDGDSVTKTLDITAVFKFEDDGVAIGGADDAIDNILVDLDGPVSSGTALLEEDPGTDGPPDIRITDYSGDGTGSNGDDLVINDITLTDGIFNDDTLVRYWQDDNENGVFDGGETLFYTYELQDLVGGDGILDTAVFTVHNAPPASNPDFSLEDLPAGQSGFGILASRMEEGDPLDPSGPALVILGREAVYDPDGTFNNQSDTINTSKGGGPTTIGNSNQMIDPPSNKDGNGEGVWFAYVEDPVDDFISSFEPDGLTQNEADNFNNIQYNGGTVETDGAFFTVVQVQGNPKVATAQVTAFNLPAGEGDGQGEQGTDLVDQLVLEGDPAMRTLTPVMIDKVVIERADGVTVDEFIFGDPETDVNFITQADANADLTDSITDEDVGSAIISGIAAGDTIRFETVGDHDAALIDGLAGKFDIGDYGLDLFNPTPDQVLEFTNTITDTDDDSDSVTHFVGIDGTGANDDGMVMF